MDSKRLTKFEDFAQRWIFGIGAWLTAVSALYIAVGSTVWTVVWLIGSWLFHWNIKNIPEIYINVAINIAVYPLCTGLGILVLSVIFGLGHGMANRLKKHNINPWWSVPQMGLYSVSLLAISVYFDYGPSEEHQYISLERAVKNCMPYVLLFAFISIGGAVWACWRLKQENHP